MAPWLVVEDFNEVLSSSEKREIRVRTERQPEDFMSALLDCELRDLGLSGPPFTWSNPRESEGMKCERLDRCVEKSD